MKDDECMVRAPWELAFLAEPREVAALRRVTRLHLKAWGLPRQIEVARLCVSELVTRVIRHVGVGAPASLRFSMNGTHLRIEVRDPRGLGPGAVSIPAPEEDMDSNLVVVDGIAERWGVLVGAECRVTWCEIACDVTAPHGHSGGARVTRAERMISRYGVSAFPQPINESRLTTLAAREVVIETIVDLLSWTEAHGYDADDVLDLAQTRFDVAQ
ncbi:ATP-binding protein [Streptomyces sp. NPDC090303]|uniref:ATP-binding protein n=1 Tax=Streptomyces sp. NPDC090303 TaxID=3365960 RepID=UPI00380D602D